MTTLFSLRPAVVALPANLRAHVDFAVRQAKSGQGVRVQVQRQNKERQRVLDVKKLGYRLVSSLICAHQTCFRRASRAQTPVAVQRSVRVRRLHRPVASSGPMCNGHSTKAGADTGSATSSARLFVDPESFLCAQRTMRCLAAVSRAEIHERD